MSVVLPLLTARLAPRRAACRRSAFIRSRTGIVKRFFAFASRPFGGDERLARMPIREAALPPRAARDRRPCDQAVGRRGRAQSARAKRRAARRRAHAASVAARLAARVGRRRAMTRVNVLLLCVLIVCALSLVTSRHQARTPDRRARARAGARAAVRRRVRPAVARAVDVGNAGARREGRPRIAAACNCPPRRASRSSKRAARREMSNASTSPCAASTCAPPAELPRVRALLVFGAVGLLLVVLLGRSLWLQWMENDFLQEPGCGAVLAGDRGARASRPHRRPVRRCARDLDAGEVAVGVSATRSMRRPSSCAISRACSRRRRSSCRRASRGDGEFAFVARQLAPETAERALALGIQGSERAERISPLLPGRRSDGAGDRLHRRQGRGPGRHRARAAGVARRHARQPARDHQPPRRHRRGRRRDPCAAGGPRSRAVGRFAAAVPGVSRAARRPSSATRRKAGGLVVIDAKSGEILALANWPTYNPNRRDKVARDKMRNRALTDTFEPGSTMKPFTIAAALEAGKIRPDTVIHTEAGELTIGKQTIHDAHRAGPLTVEQVIQKSSNVGAAKIALSLPSETLWRMFSEAGFGTLPKTGFPGEVAGRLRPPKTWKPIEQATMSYGHGLSVNLVQLARAYTIFADDGELKPVALFKTEGAVAGRPVVSVEDRARRAAHARTRDAARRHGAAGAGRRLSRRRQDRYGAQDRGSRVHAQIRRRRSSAWRRCRIRG